MMTLTQAELGVDNTQVTHISLCAGYGGIDLGLKRAIPALRTIAFSEIEAYAAANLVSKMEAGLLDAAPIWTNLKTFPWANFHGKVDIISGGFPCQPFSAAGKRNADTDERHLFPYILEGIRQCRPSLVFLENVEGIISAKLAGDHWSDPAGTPVLLHVLRELERVGYKATAGVFSASEVGAPHQRKRVFIMGYSEHYGLPTLKKLRGYETSGNQWRKEESSETRQLERTSRPIDVSGISGCEQGSELGLSKSERSERLRRCWFPESYSHDEEGLFISPSEVISNSNNNGGGEVRSVCQGADGTKPISYGESGGTELAYTDSLGDRTRLGEVQKEDGEVSQRNDNAESIQPSESRGELAYTNESGRQAGRNNSLPATPREPHESVTCGSYKKFSTPYPSRPGQPQYEWEPPRVVGNTSSLRLECARNQGSLGEESSSPKGKGCEPSSAIEEPSDTRQAMENTISFGRRRRDQDTAKYSGRSTAETEVEGYCKSRDIRDIKDEIEPSLGRDSHGPTSGMGYGELCETVESRVDELRLLGNGVVPDCATKAFVVLSHRLFEG